MAIGRQQRRAGVPARRRRAGSAGPPAVGGRALPAFAEVAEAASGPPGAVVPPPTDSVSAPVGGWVFAFSDAAIASCSFWICCWTFATFFALG